MKCGGEKVCYICDDFSVPTALNYSVYIPRQIPLASYRDS